MYTAQKHNRLSVKPFLSVWHQNINDGLIIFLNNLGAGPAVIKSYEIFLDGHKIEGQGVEPIRKAVSLLFQSANVPQILNSSYLTKGGALGQKESICIVHLQFTSDTFPTPDFMEHFYKRVKLVVKYTSLYEDQEYTYDSHINHKIH